ncbi:hypothetical protein C8R43DRAFT_943465 [Mycena crocata]|nr:hypothetical protein C8R43DRAFT_943465 [Mycena crocata]
MWSLPFFLEALLSFLALPGLEAEPGFTYCYEPYLGGTCVNASTPPNQCVNVPGQHNDKASSARANANSQCTLYKHGNCVGETLDIAPLQTINKFSDYNFDNLMSAYRCNWAVQPPTQLTCHISVTDTVNGTEYGYIGIPTNPYGFYRVESARASAVIISFSYSESPSRLNLRAMNGRMADSTFPFLGGMFDYLPEFSMGPGHSEWVDVIGTGETPSGAPQVTSLVNSVSAVAGYALPMESHIWRYNPDTRVITAQWTNPDGSEPETTTVILWESLKLSGDVEALRRINAGVQVDDVLGHLWVIRDSIL